MIELIHNLTVAFVDYSPLPTVSDPGKTEQTVLDLVFALSGSISVLMIVISGFRYIIARGDPNGTASAKNAIVYSIIGLVVVMAAYSIVTFVVKGIS